MRFQDHPSLVKHLRPSSKVKVKVPRNNAPEKFVKKWKLCNEERLLALMEKVGRIQLRVKFEILEDGNYKTLNGTTLVFKGIPNQGVLWSITDELTRAGLEEAQEWTKKLISRQSGGTPAS